MTIPTTEEIRTGIKLTHWRGFTKYEFEGSYYGDYDGLITIGPASTQEELDQLIVAFYEQRIDESKFRRNTTEAKD